MCCMKGSMHLSVPWFSELFYAPCLQLPLFWKSVYFKDHIKLHFSTTYPSKCSMEEVVALQAQWDDCNGGRPGGLLWKMEVGVFC